jgi:hypothetical protein
LCLPFLCRPQSRCWATASGNHIGQPQGLPLQGIGRPMGQRPYPTITPVGAGLVPALFVPSTITVLGNRIGQPYWATTRVAPTGNWSPYGQRPYPMTPVGAGLVPALFVPPTIAVLGNRIGQPHWATTRVAPTGNRSPHGSTAVSHHYTGRGWPCACPFCAVYNHRVGQPYWAAILGNHKGCPYRKLVAIWSTAVSHDTGRGWPCACPFCAAHNHRVGQTHRSAPTSWQTIHGRDQSSGIRVIFHRPRPVHIRVDDIVYGRVAA